MGNKNVSQLTALSEAIDSSADFFPVWNNSASSLQKATPDEVLTGIGVLHQSGVNGAENTNNTAVGYRALVSKTTGQGNTAFGSNACYLTTTGSENTAFGWLALATNVDGGANVAVGAGTLTANVSGLNNTAVGEDALAKQRPVIILLLGLGPVTKC